jgi:hypothetical protein
MSSHQEGIQTDEVDDVQLAARAQADAEAREKLREIKEARAEQARLLNESRARARAECRGTHGSCYRRLWNGCKLGI